MFKKSWSLTFLFTFFSLTSNFTLFGKSLLIPDEHGWAYLIGVENETTSPAKLEFKNVGFDIAGTGLGPFNIPAGGTLGDRPKEIEETAGGFFAPGSAIRKTRIWQGGKPVTGEKDTKVNKKPTIYGSGIKTISQFDASKMLVLKPMHSKAIAWFAQQNLTNPRRPKLDMTFSFVGYVRDKGELQVVFSEKEKIGPDWIWKIILSSSPTGRAIVMRQKGKNVEEVASVNNVEFPEARLMPGTFTRFWISLRGNQIVLGKGSDGQNPFLVWQDPGKLRSIKRVGFSSADNPISIARISAMSAVHPQVIGQPMAILPKSDFSKKGIILREPGAGALAFKTSDFTSLEFSSSSNPETKVKLEISGNEAVISQSSKGGQAKPKKFVLNSSIKDFWLTFDQDRLLFGQGLPNKTGILSGSAKSKIFKTVNNIKFSSPPAAGVAIFSQLKMVATTWTGSHSGKPMFSGDIKIYQPYAYEFYQSGPVITGKDLIFNKTYLLGKAPQQGAIYPFFLKIKSDGTPELDWDSKPVNVGKFMINASAMALRVSEAAMYKVAEDATDQDSDALYSIGVATAGATTGVGAVAAAANREAAIKIGDAAVTGGNIAAALGGAALASAAALIEAEADLGFRDEKAYGYTETASQKVAKKTKMDRAEQFADKFGLLMVKAKQLNLSSKKDLDYAFQLYADAIALIKDSQVITNAQRGELVSGLTSIVASAGVIYKNPKMVASKVARILLMALTNHFFINRNDLKQKSYSDSLNMALQNIFEKLFFESGRDKVNIPKADGKFLWTGKSFEKEGSIYFKAKGAGGLLVHLLPVPPRTPNSKIGEFSWLEKGSPVYEVGLGVERNSMSCIKVSHQGQAVKKILSRKNRQAAMSSFKPKPYWVNFSDGVITVGQGVWGKGKILEWKDPYPTSGKFMLGLSGDSGAIQVSDVRVGPPVKKLTKKIISGKTADEIAREKKIAEEKKSDLSGLDQEKSMKLEQAKSALDVDLLQDYDPFKYDQLAMTNMQLQYNPLEYGELAMEQYQRAQQEHAAVQEFASKKVIEKDEDAELEKKKQALSARQKSQKAAQTRQSRGAAQKLEAEGMYGVQMELTVQAKGVKNDIMAAGGFIKGGIKGGFQKTQKAIKNMGRKMAELKAKFAGEEKRRQEKEQMASQMTANDSADLSSQKTQKVERNMKNRQSNDGPDNQKRMRSAAQEQEAAGSGRRGGDDDDPSRPKRGGDDDDPSRPKRGGDDDSDDPSKPKKASDDDDDDEPGEMQQKFDTWTKEGEVGREIGQLKDILTSGKIIDSIKNAPAKIVYEFTGKKIGKLKDMTDAQASDALSRRKRGKGAGGQKALAAMDKEGRQADMSVRNVDATRDRDSIRDVGDPADQLRDQGEQTDPIEMQDQAVQANPADIDQARDLESKDQGIQTDPIEMQDQAVQANPADIDQARDLQSLAGDVASLVKAAKAGNLDASSQDAQQLKALGYSGEISETQKTAKPASKWQKLKKRLLKGSKVNKKAKRKKARDGMNKKDQKHQAAAFERDQEQQKAFEASEAKERDSVNNELELQNRYQLSEDDEDQIVRNIERDFAVLKDEIPPGKAYRSALAIADTRKDAIAAQDKLIDAKIEISKERLQANKKFDSVQAGVNKAIEAIDKKVASANSAVEKQKQALEKATPEQKAAEQQKLSDLEVAAKKVEEQAKLDKAEQDKKLNDAEVQTKEKLQELKDQEIEAENEFTRINDIAKKTFFHSNAQKVWEDGFKLRKAEEQRDKVQKQMEAATGSKKAKLQEELKQLDKKVKKERKKFEKSVDGTFDKFSSVAAAIGDADMQIHDAKNRILEAQDQMKETAGEIDAIRQDLEALEQDQSLSPEDKQDALKQLSDDLEAAQTDLKVQKDNVAADEQLIDEKLKYSKKFGAYSNDEAELILSRDKLTDIESREKELNPKDPDYEELKQQLNDERAGLMDEIKEKMGPLDKRVKNPEKWIIDQGNTIDKKYSGPLGFAKAIGMKALGNMAKGGLISMVSGGGDESNEEEQALTQSAEQQLEELGFVDTDDLN